MGCTSSRDTVVQNSDRNHHSNRHNHGHVTSNSRSQSRTSTLERPIIITPPRLSSDEGRMTSAAQRMMQRDPLFFAHSDLIRDGTGPRSRRRRLHRFIRNEDGRAAERRFSPHPTILDFDSLDIAGLVGRSQSVERVGEASQDRTRGGRHELESFDIRVNDVGNEFRYSQDNNDHLNRLRSDLETFELLFQTLLRHTNNDQRADTPFQGCPPASTSVIERLPIMKISERDFEDEPKKECSICFLDFKVGDEVCRLPCSHIFHKECVSEWLKKKCTCPECRWELETEDQRYEIERVDRMKSRKSRIKDHELDRLCIEALQDMAGDRELTNREKLIERIKGLDTVDVIVAT